MCLGQVCKNCYDNKRLTYKYIHINYNFTILVTKNKVDNIDVLTITRRIKEMFMDISALL